MANRILDDDDLDELNLIIYGMPRQVFERADYFHTFDELTFFLTSGGNEAFWLAIFSSSMDLLEILTEVLEEIISDLVSKELLGDLMDPKPNAEHEDIRNIIEDITQSSSMRLDSVSMDKLWDLITMVFKWQLSVTDDVIGLTLRHLYEIENYVINPETHEQLQKVQNLIENFNKILTRQEKIALFEKVTDWLKIFNVRVSLLLRMGLQDVEGNFVTKNLTPIAEELMKNIGENIYQVTQNGRIMENQDNSFGDHQQNKPILNELELFANELLGGRMSSENTETNRNSLKLTIKDVNANQESKKVTFDPMDVNVENSNISDLIEYIRFDDEENNLTEQFLDLIEDNVNK